MVLDPKKQRKSRKSDEKNDVESIEAPQQEVQSTRLLGINSISAFLKRCPNWVIHRRQEYPDFPVRQDNYTHVWESTEEELAEWRDKHIDLFTSRRERLEERHNNNDEKRPSHW